MGVVESYLHRARRSTLEHGAVVALRVAQAVSQEMRDSRVIARTPQRRGKGVEASAERGKLQAAFWPEVQLHTVV